MKNLISFKKYLTIFALVLGVQTWAAQTGVALKDASIYKVQKGQKPKAIGKLKKGMQYNILKMHPNGKWAAVKDGGVTGWVKADQLKISGMAPAKAKSEKKQTTEEVADSDSEETSSGIRAYPLEINGSWNENYGLGGGLSFHFPIALGRNFITIGAGAEIFPFNQTTATATTAAAATLPLIVTGASRFWLDLGAVQLAPELFFSWAKLLKLSSAASATNFGVGAYVALPLGSSIALNTGGRFGFKGGFNYEILGAVAIGF